MGGIAITLDVIAFITLASAFAIYGLYASTASLRDPAGSGLLSNTGVITASFGAVGLFLIPWLAREGGYPAAATALIGVTVPLAATLLSLRGWTIARTAGANGIGETIARTYGTGLAILNGVIVAAAATILIALVLAAAASMVEALSAAEIGQPVALHLAALFLLLSGAPAGIHAAGKLARLHTGLVLLGSLAAGGLVVVALGGVDATVRALADVGSILNWSSTGGRGGGNYNQALAVAGAFGADTIWTGTTILSVQIALGGTVLMLIWLPRSIAVRDPRRFVRQVGYGAVFGGALLIATTFLLGLAALQLDRSLTIVPLVPFPGRALSEGSIARIIDTIANERFWSASALLGLGAGAALHALALSLLSAAIGALRPIWARRRDAPNAMQRDLAISQGVSAAIIVGALLLALLPAADLAAMGGLALALAPLVALTFTAICWFPATSQSGLIAGLIVGIAVVCAEVTVGAAVHAASTGLLAAAVVAAAISVTGRRDSRFGLRVEIHRLTDQILARTTDERGHEGSPRSLALIGTTVWIFFAVGPGVVIGNDLFGAPDLAQSRWDFPIPSIAVWQLLAWASGVGLVWFYTRLPGIATITREQIDQINAQMARPPKG
ncbi:MAG: sodium:solute symporter [Rhodospirillales bacterium]|nr:sodium:solute symporter [Rhodospirillales bacterium]